MAFVLWIYHLNWDCSKFLIFLLYDIYKNIWLYFYKTKSINIVNKEIFVIWYMPETIVKKILFAPFFSFYNLSLIFSMWYEQWHSSWQCTLHWNWTYLVCRIDGHLFGFNHDWHVSWYIQRGSNLLLNGLLDWKTIWCVGFIVINSFKLSKIQNQHIISNIT